ncbi:exo-beta-N-acetylmuramidase NamZ family protein [Eudoraea adriatica]|uniref:exo-beta-N-acetylmuramidase NamZ family protein n=1 Tax=Eudoraea adriatica TaxID=446681 RepID=UPI00036C121E|nr:DUF1343 domain-containing protein [Eudoraea adriatica]
MAFLSRFKNTFLLWLLILTACGNNLKKDKDSAALELPKTIELQDSAIVAGANSIEEYLPRLRGKKVGVVANQTSIIFKNNSPGESPSNAFTHLVDSLLLLNIDIEKVFAPEHGFRGMADAGEHVKDGMDAKTGIPIISLYGKNRKPTSSQLEGLDIVVFDIQDVGVRFYTYIATLQLVMEACAEKGIPVLVLDRPNPNGHYVDGPTMEIAHKGFLGLTPIPLVYGMTIGEYANMINNEGWLEKGIKADLAVIPLRNYSHNSDYKIPVRPSPNLPNEVAINLYPSLGLFEGTNINAGRGTESQFQRYGAPFLDSTAYDFSYVPKPNFGSKNPKHSEKKCFGKDLSSWPKMNEVSLQWLIDAYHNASDKKLVFNSSGFTKHAGTEKLQQQIEAGLSEKEIRESWQKDLDKFRKIRSKYLLYK